VDGNGIEDFRLSFVEASILASLYERLDYTILSQDVLTMQLDQSHMKQLDVAELKQIRSWKPQTIAEVIFNWWD
jgi:hypothetical protein